MDIDDLGKMLVQGHLTIQNLPGSIFINRSLRNAMLAIENFGKHKGNVEVSFNVMFHENKVIFDSENFNTGTHHNVVAPEISKNMGEFLGNFHTHPLDEHNLSTSSPTPHSDVDIDTMTKHKEKVAFVMSGYWLYLMIYHTESRTPNPNTIPIFYNKIESLYDQHYRKRTGLSNDPQGTFIENELVRLGATRVFTDTVAHVADTLRLGFYRGKIDIKEDLVLYRILKQTE